MSLPSRTQEWLNARLCELQRTLEDMGPDFSGFAAATYQLCRRLEEGRFRLAVLGQFKRGKSTLLNALIREPLLPTGVLPLTAIPTTIRYGRDRHVRITFRNGHTEDFDGSLETLQQVLKRYVTEEENPANELGVAQVEVDHPATILASGVEIIDTPGIGSTLLHNTRTARETLPICDGAVFVLSPDPPITEAEVQFLKAVHEAATRVIFVLTKTDTLMSSDREALLPFLRKILHDQAGFAGQQIAPKGGSIVADGGNRPHTGDKNSCHRIDSLSMAGENDALRCWTLNLQRCIDSGTTIAHLCTSWRACGRIFR